MFTEDAYVRAQLYTALYNVLRVIEVNPLATSKDFWNEIGKAKDLLSKYPALEIKQVNHESA